LEKIFTPINAWESVGITKHFGGADATEELLKWVVISKHSKVLDVGCGTGYTACHITNKFGCRVAGIDTSAILLNMAINRAKKLGVISNVLFKKANAEHIPFPDNTFDVVLSESVLSLCESKKVISEIHRVLKKDGVFLSNEVTYIKKPSDKLSRYFSKSLNINLSIFTRKGWESLFKNSGFKILKSSAYRIRYSTEVKSHFKVDAPLKVVTAFASVLCDKKFRETYLNLELLKGWSKFLSYAGYGLYVCKK
jgi:ubiquinone/menaquinone biosynthesis C-methylase UbiE